MSDKSNSDLGCATLIIAGMLLWLCFSVSQVAVAVGNVSIELKRIADYCTNPPAAEKETVKK